MYGRRQTSCPGAFGSKTKDNLCQENESNRAGQETAMESDTRVGAYVWEVLYEKAISERDPLLRPQRLGKAEQAILKRVSELDGDSAEHEEEAQALEEAADVVQEMRLRRIPTGNSRTS